MYSLNDNEAAVIGYYKPAGSSSVIIPSSVSYNARYYTVTSISASAFANQTSVTSITIPSTVKSIGEKAFYYAGIKSVSIPSSVTNIGSSAFEGSSITSVTISEGVRTIGSRAFNNCNSLTTVSIPSSVTTIGTLAFNNCDSLTAINVNSSNSTYSSALGVLFNNSRTTLIQYPAGKIDTDYTVPASVTTIGGFSFDRCRLQRVVISPNVTNVGEGAFDSPRHGVKILLVKGTYIEAYAKVNGPAYEYLPVTSIAVTTAPTKTVYNIGETFSASGMVVTATYERGYTRVVNASPAIETLTYGTTEVIISYTEEGTTKITTQAITVKDNVKPTITSVTGNPTAWTNQNVTLTVNATDAHSGVKEYSFDNGATWQTGRTKSFSANGTINIKARDNEGNESNVHTVNINRIDKTAPTLTVAGNPTAWTNQDVTLTVTGSDAGSGIATSNGYSFDNGATWQTSNVKQFSANGTIRIKVKDIAGNESSVSTVDITRIDKTAPTITGVAGNPTAWTNQDVTLTVTGSDAGSGIATASGYSFDDGATWQTSSAKKFTANGTIKIKVKDAVGNVSAATTVAINRIDKTVPTITGVAGNPTAWTNQDVTLTVTGADANSGILTTNGYSFDDGATWQTANSKVFSSNQSVKIKVKDTAGNVSATNTVTINKIDKTIPTIEISPNGSTASDSKTVKITIKETGGSGLSGNNKYQYQLSKSNTTVPTGTWLGYDSRRTICNRNRINRRLLFMDKRNRRYSRK